MPYRLAKPELVRTAGIELATDGSQSHCSTRLSYVLSDALWVERVTFVLDAGVAVEALRGAYSARVNEKLPAVSRFRDHFANGSDAGEFGFDCLLHVCPFGLLFRVLDMAGRRIHAAGSVIDERGAGSS